MPRETDINTALAEEKAAQKRLNALREKAVEIHGENIAVAELGGTLPLRSFATHSYAVAGPSHTTPLPHVTKLC